METKYGFIKARLSALHKTQVGLAQALKVESPRVNEIIKGRREFQLNELIPAAKFLEYDPVAFFKYAAGEMVDINTLESPRPTPDSAQGYDRTLLTHVLSTTEEWLQQNDYSMSPDDKVALMFALYDNVKDMSPAERSTQIIRIADVISRMKRTG